MGSASNAAASPGRVLNWRSCGFRSLQQHQQRQMLPFPPRQRPQRQRHCRPLTLSCQAMTPRYPNVESQWNGSDIWQQGWISSKFPLRAVISKRLDGPNILRPQELDFQ